MEMFLVLLTSCLGWNDDNGGVDGEGRDKPHTARYGLEHVSDETCSEPYSYEPFASSSSFMIEGWERPRGVAYSALTHQDSSSNYPPSHIPLAFRSKKNLWCSSFGYLHSKPYSIIRGAVCDQEQGKDSDVSQTFKDRGQYYLQRLCQPQLSSVRAHPCRRIPELTLFDSKGKIKRPGLTPPRGFLTSREILRNLLLWLFGREEEGRFIITQDRSSSKVQSVVWSPAPPPPPLAQPIYTHSNPSLSCTQGSHRAVVACARRVSVRQKASLGPSGVSEVEGFTSYLASSVQTREARAGSRS